ncbi:MAG: Yip1 family protein [Anaerolineales bacterium]|nr:Yip1 family protein [Anaerolineales bacterium]
MDDQFIIEGGNLDPTPPGPPKYPYLTIWYKPRGTMRAILDYNPEMWIYPLAALVGINQAFEYAARSNAGDALDLWAILLLVAAGGPILGVIAIWIGGAIFAWIGGLFGGQGTFQDVRAALAWAAIPSIFTLALNLVSLLILRQEAFTSTTPQMDAAIESNLFFAVVVILFGLGSIFLGIILTIWALIISVKTMAEAHQFSSWRGLATVALPTIVLLGTVLICVLPTL